LVAPPNIELARRNLQKFAHERAIIIPLREYVQPGRGYGVPTDESFATMHEVLAQKRERIAEIMTGGTGGTSLRERLPHIRAKLDQTRGRRLIGLETGMAELDRRLLGIRGLSVIGAMPGLGKRMMCLQIATGIARHHHDAIVVFFSLEMPKDDLCMRMLSAAADIDWRDFALSDPTADTEESRAMDVRIEESERRLESERVYDRVRIFDREQISDRLTAAQIVSRVTKCKEQAGASRALVVVDYLGLIDVDDNAMKPLSDLQQDKKRVRIVQDALQKLNTESPGNAMIAINEARKPSNSKETWGNGLAELMGSARLGYAVDAALLYRRMNDTEIARYYDVVEGEVERQKERLDHRGIAPVVLAIEKGRDGTTRGDIPMSFNFRKLQFNELEVRPARRNDDADPIARESLNGNGRTNPLDRAEAGDGVRADQAEFDHVAEMSPVLVTERRELDPRQRVEREHAERVAGLGLGDVRVRLGLVITDLFVGEHDVDRVADLRVRAVEEGVDALGVPIDEPGGLERRPRRIELATPEQHVDVPGVPHRRLVHP